ncbi:hypothetical protein BASA61_009874 [Batrachochytrium salamandrivorans]|nr:hypothetical protein BASA60_010770 [Batrachochytrium salamandrivorans]KAH6580062.1 hypothetical protein BASA61_009874 [Batrachochytrium salamandrivorans]KAH9268859.1 hypothetical protein BASA83_009147 [Batrachochytrium salamandrivorans]
MLQTTPLTERDGPDATISIDGSSYSIGYELDTNSCDIMESTLPWLQDIQLSDTHLGDATSFNMSSLAPTAAVKEAPSLLLKKRVQELEQHLSSRSLGVSDDPNPLLWEKARLLDIISQEILLDATDTGNALESIWRLSASHDIMQELQKNKASSMAFLGLSGDDWSRFVHRDLQRQVSPSIQEMFEKRLDRAVCEKCYTLVRFLLGLAPDAAVTQDTMQKFTSKIETTLSEINHNQVEVLRGYIDIIDQYEIVLSNHATATHHITRWITVFCGEIQTSLHDTFASYFQVIHSNLRLKLECLKLDLVNSISSNQIGNEMQKAREDLTYANQEIQNSLASITSQLSEYSTLGSEFHQIVNSYSVLTQELLAIERDLTRLDAPR